MRREFSRAVRVAVIKRATRQGVIYCEKCNAMAKRFQIDHIRPDGLLGEPTIENAMLICEPCWLVKNSADTTAIASAKRKEAAHLGARRPKQPLKSGANLLGPERSHADRQIAAVRADCMRKFADDRRARIRAAARADLGRDCVGIKFYYATLPQTGPFC